jgi:hypothetical protein
MTRPYLVYRNGALYTRVLTQIKARRLVEELRQAGFKASFAETLGENASSNAEAI